MHQMTNKNMKKMLVLICLLIFGLPAFAQEMRSDGHPAQGNNGIDFVILEMKLGAVLGGFKDGKFVNAEAASNGVKLGEEYSLFGLNLDKSDGVLKLTKMHEPDIDVCPEYYSVETDDKAQSGVALSSNARWNPTPRTPKEIDPKNRVYRAIVRKFIRTKGIKSPDVEIKKILKVDLEGDGQDEVIIQASNRKDRPGFDTKTGDYSIIMLRKIVKGKVKEFLLAGDITTKDIEGDIPYNYELSAILDLDADGKMEIVVYGAYYEGSWAEAIQLKNGKAKSILNSGCGV